jgi:pimeloyl-ACP methyl ester carboxylesterase
MNDNERLESFCNGVIVAGQAVHRAYRWTAELVHPDARRHLAQLPGMALTSLGPRRRRVRPLPNDGHRPLIFVHGLGGHPGNHLALRSHLGLSGRRRIYTVDLGKGTPLAEAAREVSTAVERVVAANGLGAEDQVDLIAHSMGGLVCRLAINEVITRRRVARIVTMGSPHQGTFMARLVGPTAARTQELRVDSETIATLATQLPWPNDWPHLVSLWSPNDVLVMPEARAEVAGADNRRCEGFTHFTWLLEPRGWNEVERALA